MLVAKAANLPLRDHQSVLRKNPRSTEIVQRSVCKGGSPCQTKFSRIDSMNFIIWLVVGGLIGWVASMIMKTDAQQGVILNVVVGIVGAFIGGWLISPLVGVPTINQDAFSVGALLVSLLGAVILLAIVNLLRRGRVT
jgi:uncharacterized membrane protein YeaQ/YmgE (transglycosylase-associated protein family)